ncbi:MAG TPA: hypothetical protein VGW38_24235 [Chloroflexota bacterium]|nr:hypothetical protein [Chloroflexota bacterium]
MRHLIETDYVADWLMGPRQRGFGLLMRATLTYFGLAILSTVLINAVPSIDRNVMMGLILPLTQLLYVLTFFASIMLMLWDLVTWLVPMRVLSLIDEVPSFGG